MPYYLEQQRALFRGATVGKEHSVKMIYSHEFIQTEPSQMADLGPDPDIW